MKINSTVNSIEQFRDAMRSAGLEPPLIIEAGKFYRFPGVGKKQNNRAAWCRLFPDMLGGSFGDFSSGLSNNWHANNGGCLTTLELNLFNKHLDETRAQMEMERQTMQNKAKIRANRIWKISDPAQNNHPYLLSKRIKALGLKIYKGDLTIGGMLCDGAIIIPLFYRKEIMSLQFINHSGEKRFLPGGKITGCYYLIEGTQLLSRDQLYVAEGFATAAIIHELTHCPVAVAFNANNLKSVAMELRKLSSSVELVIACDNDRNTVGNPGMTCGREAAANAGALFVWPDFPCEDCTCTDFNDLVNCQRNKKRAV
jgi:putative DNA primase/helicase